jgi:dolichol-phosphate mannosyltransferase
MNEMGLSVIIPAYQEEENLRVILPRLETVLGDLPVASEVLVVDTMEKMDETEAECCKNGVHYCRRAGGNDYGCAIQTGIELAKGEYLVFMDADGSHSPEFVRDLFENRMRGNVIVASRYITGGNTENPFFLILMSRIVNIVYSIALGLRCKDISNSFKLYRRSDIQKLQLKSRDFDIVEEILFKLKKTNKSINIVELPYTFKARQFGQTKRNLAAFILSYLKTLFRLRFDR